MVRLEMLGVPVIPQGERVRLTRNKEIQVNRLRRLVLLGPFVLLLSLSACGGSADGGEDTEPSANATPEVQQRAFLEAMVPHHRSAVEMAEAADGRLEEPAIREIQAAVTKTQTAEIAEMERIHERLFGTELKPNERAHEQLGMSATQAGMGHMRGGESIRTAKAPVDRAFIDQMVPHHEGAIRMAEAVLKRATDRELRALAEEISKAQRKEVKTMKEVRSREFGGPVPPPAEMGSMHGGQ